MKKSVIIGLLLTVTLCACPVLAQDEDDFDEFEDEFAEQVITVADPLQPINRFMFNFNDFLYFKVIKPLARSYRKVTPHPARIGMRNFFHNLATPGRFLNCVLQGKGKAAGIEFKRFVINTTVGVIGLGDPAGQDMGLKPVPEDFGQTMGKAGIGNGFYLVLPVLGPSTLRDTVGRLGDSLVNPIVYIEDSHLYMLAAVAKAANEYSFRLGDYEAIKADTVDPYVAMRNAYIQYRRQQIKN